MKIAFGAVCLVFLFPVESGVGRCSSGHVACIMLCGCWHGWCYHSVGITATGSSPLQCCKSCFIWKEVEERRCRICYPPDRLSCLQGTIRAAHYFQVLPVHHSREGGCLIWNTPLSPFKDLSPSLVGMFLSSPRNCRNTQLCNPLPVSIFLGEWWTRNSNKAAVVLRCSGSICPYLWEQRAKWRFTLLGLRSLPFNLVDLSLEEPWFFTWRLWCAEWKLLSVRIIIPQTFTELWIPLPQPRCFSQFSLSSSTTKLLASVYPLTALPVVWPLPHHTQTVQDLPWIFFMLLTTVREKWYLTEKTLKQLGLIDHSEGALPVLSWLPIWDVLEAAAAFPSHLNSVNKGREEARRRRYFCCDCNM